jgi:transcriptional regulator with XRE-family HTH domain
LNLENYISIIKSVTKRHAPQQKGAERGKMAENKIKAFRESMGLTQQEFADELGVTRVAISNYELGRREPSGAFFAKLKKRYNLTDQTIGGMLLEYAKEKQAIETC